MREGISLNGENATTGADGKIALAFEGTPLE